MDFTDYIITVQRFTDESENLHFVFYWLEGFTVFLVIVTVYCTNFVHHVRSHNYPIINFPDYSESSILMYFVIRQFYELLKGLWLISIMYLASFTDQLNSIEKSRSSILTPKRFVLILGHFQVLFYQQKHFQADLT